MGLEGSQRPTTGWRIHSTPAHRISLSSVLMEYYPCLNLTNRMDGSSFMKSLGSLQLLYKHISAAGEEKPYSGPAKGDGLMACFH
jgi:hypothetical protein